MVNIAAQRYSFVASHRDDYKEHPHAIKKKMHRTPLIRLNNV